MTILRDPPLHGLRRVRLHPEDARHRGAARGVVARVPQGGLGAAQTPT